MKLEEMRKLCDELGPLKPELDGNPEDELWLVRCNEGVVCDLTAEKYAVLFTHFEKLLKVAEAARDVVIFDSKESIFHGVAAMRQALSDLESP